MRGLGVFLGQSVMLKAVNHQDVNSVCDVILESACASAMFYSLRNRPYMYMYISLVCICVSSEVLSNAEDLGTHWRLICM